LKGHLSRNLLYALRMDALSDFECEIGLGEEMHWSTVVATAFETDPETVLHENDAILLPFSCFDILTS
jgi:hypothetical protein